MVGAVALFLVLGSQVSLVCVGGVLGGVAAKAGGASREPANVAEPTSRRRRRGIMAIPFGSFAQESSVAAKTIGWAGGVLPREPANGLLEKSKMPPSAATMR